jgi:alkylation response protein AidB-like acyl-CoA dehydrogenase
MYYGNRDQRERYVTKLASGDFIGAYCLTEPGAGSDANSGKTNARLSEDGKNYILNGQKMWITNAGFADTLVVFAKIDTDRVLSAFIVETKYPGVWLLVLMSTKWELKDLQQHRSISMMSKYRWRICLERGEKVSGLLLSILHMGRLKLGANVIGAAKKAINDSVKYANERKQFGGLISRFGAIKTQNG